MQIHTNNLKPNLILINKNQLSLVAHDFSL